MDAQRHFCTESWQMWYRVMLRLQIVCVFHVFLTSAKEARFKALTYKFISSFVLDKWLLPKIIISFCVFSGTRVWLWHYDLLCKTYMFVLKVTQKHKYIRIVLGNWVCRCLLTQVKVMLRIEFLVMERKMGSLFWVKSVSFKWTVYCNWLWMTMCFLLLYLIWENEWPSRHVNSRVTMGLFLYRPIFTFYIISYIECFLLPKLNIAFKIVLYFTHIWVSSCWIYTAQNYKITSYVK